MGLVINSNLPALNAENILNRNSQKNKSSMEKLASGFKINHAADDASGLAISEKMRNMITALDTQNDVDEDAINLINTADGYLAEIQDMVERMTELTMKSANGVLADRPDRDNLQKEMDEICGEIDRIASTANFNGIKLFNGKYAASKIVKEKITVDSDEDIPYSNLIKDVKKLTADQLINDNEIETVKFLANKAHEYVVDHGNDVESVNNKAIYYTEKGEPAIVAANNADEADIRSQLGLSDSDKLLKAETNYFGVKIYGVAIPETHFLDGDTNGDKTRTYLEDELNKYKSGYSSLKCMIGKKIFYTDDGKNAFVASKNTSIKDVIDRFNGMGADDPTKYKSLDILTAEESYPFYTIEEGTEITVDKKVFEPLRLKIGVTSTSPEWLDLETYDLHTNNLFIPEYKTVCTGTHEATRKITEINKIPCASAGGTIDSSQSAFFTVNQEKTYYETYTAKTYETISVNAVKISNDSSTFRNPTVPDISTQDNAIKNIDNVKSLSERISTIRGNYAAKQNRIEHTINNLMTESENVSAAKSRIKDTDMAAEMAKFTISNVLNQAAQAMLSQANSQPQSILSLIQG